MSNNPLLKIEKFGQAIWLDYIKRDLFSQNKLQKLITDYVLRGMTSNPSIFEKAIAESQDYDAAIRSMVENGKNVTQIYDALTQKDVQDAADVFRSIYDRTNGLDGYVSLEVNPHLGHDTKGTVEEARLLWKGLNRPNVLIKVPGTKEGIPAIKQLISEGISVNVTLLFSVSRYKEVAEAYISGLENLAAQGKDLKKVVSVASFFLSRIDVLVDPMLEKNMQGASAEAKLAQQLHGETAVASARIAYKAYSEIYKSERFKKLAAKGARPQRLLWASTSTKNKAYSDVKYIEALIGPETVNTVPLETIEKYHDHGDPKLRLTQELDKAALLFEKLPQFGIDIDKVTQQLEKEGVEQFIKAYDKLIESLKTKMAKS